METPHSGEVAHIGKSVAVKGDLSGSENLYVDGNVEGTIELRDHMLTIGPNGNVKANVSAKSVVIHGKLDGTITASAGSNDWRAASLTISFAVTASGSCVAPPFCAVASSAFRRRSLADPLI